MSLYKMLHVLGRSLLRNSVIQIMDAVFVTYNSEHAMMRVSH